MEYTTLALCKKHNACPEGYAKLKKHLGEGWKVNDPIPLLTVLESNGIEDAIWALRTLEGKDREIRHFACDCAERVLPICEKKYPDDKRPRNAIEVSRKFADGLATAEELVAARNAAGGAAREAARNAAWGAAWDAAWGAAGGAAWGAAGGAAREAARVAAREAARVADWGAEREWQAERFKFYFCGETAPAGEVLK